MFYDLLMYMCVPACVQLLAEARREYLELGGCELHNVAGNRTCLYP